MGQTKLIHEHYDSKPWASIISGLLIAGLASLRVFEDRGEHSWIYVLIFAIWALPAIALLVLDIIWKKKPTLIVYNDRLEVRKAMSSKRVEILYSDIRNMALESGQLRIWVDEFSKPACYNMGANLVKAQESYDILHTAYDEYNQEHNFKPVPLWDLPKKRAGIGKLIFFLSVFFLLVVYQILCHFFG
jgi:hypothetical protein